jgi:hypothetical protein
MYIVFYYLYHSVDLFTWSYGVKGSILAPNSNGAENKALQIMAFRNA